MGGIFSAILLPFGFPLIQRRYGTWKMHCTLSYLWVIVYLSLPALNVIARLFVQPVGADGAQQVSSVGDKVLWLGIGTVVLLSRIASMMFS